MLQLTKETSIRRGEELVENDKAAKKKWKVRSREEGGKVKNEEEAGGGQQKERQMLVPRMPVRE